ncbi:hypothetical protein HanIR_Chr04g0200701 [Helianthus annuus]|nr:hypothetical protein HanIR_Chr04g0200701 [Helianthus annuus]
MRDIFWRSMGRKVANTENLTKNCGTKLPGGKKRGKVYGLSNVKNDFNVQHHGKQGQEIERLNVIIQDIVKEKEEEKEMLNDIIAGLVVEKEKDKAEKEIMNERMANIEVMLKARFQNA